MDPKREMEIPDDKEMDNLLGEFLRNLPNNAVEGMRIGLKSAFQRRRMSIAEVKEAVDPIAIRKKSIHPESGLSPNEILAALKNTEMAKHGDESNASSVPSSRRTSADVRRRSSTRNGDGSGKRPRKKSQKSRKAGRKNSADLLVSSDVSDDEYASNTSLNNILELINEFNSKCDELLDTLPANDYEAHSNAQPNGTTEAALKENTGEADKNELTNGKSKNGSAEFDKSHIDEISDISGRLKTLRKKIHKDIKKKGVAESKGKKGANSDEQSKGKKASADKESVTGNENSENSLTVPDADKVPNSPSKGRRKSIISRMKKKDPKNKKENDKDGANESDKTKDESNEKKIPDNKGSEENSATKIEQIEDESKMDPAKESQVKKEKHDSDTEPDLTNIITKTEGSATLIQDLADDDVTMKLALETNLDEYTEVDMVADDLLEDGEGESSPEQARRRNARYSRVKHGCFYCNVM